MADYTAKDIQTLRRTTGVGMLDAKRALEENAGDPDQATQWLREKGIAGNAKLAGREAAQGAVAVARFGPSAAIVELRCETDFVAKATEFVTEVEELARRVAEDGEAAAPARTAEIEALRSTLKENISLGQVIRLTADEGQVLDTYLHRQAGRGVNAVVVVLADGSEDLAHDLAVHIAFARPTFIRREDVPEEDVARERATLETISRNEGKPEAALEKIVEGRLNGWFKERCLVEQPYAKDDKKTVREILGSAEVVRFAQVTAGA